MGIDRPRVTRTQGTVGVWLVASIVLGACAGSISVDGVAAPTPTDPSSAEATPSPSPDEEAAATGSEQPEPSTPLLGPADMLPYTEVLTSDPLPELARCMSQHANAVPEADVALLTEPLPDDAYAPSHYAGALGAASEAARNAVLDAADRCLPVALVVVDPFSDDIVRAAKCVLDSGGSEIRWADVVSPDDDHGVNPEALAVLLPPDLETCFEVPHAGEVSEDDPRSETIRAWGDLWDALGINVDRDIRECLVVEAESRVDLLASLESLGEAEFRGLGQALEVCLPFVGVIAEPLDLGIVTSVCLLDDARMADAWARALEAGELALSGQEDLARDQLLDVVTTPVQDCLATPGSTRIISELGEDWDAEVLLATEQGVWVGGWGDSNGNLLLIDAESGTVLESHDTDGSIETITVDADADAVWVGRGFQLKRLNRATGQVDVTVDANEREFGKILIAGDRLWVPDATSGSLLALDPDTGEILSETAIYPDGWYAGRTDLLSRGDDLWFGHDGESTVYRISLATGEIVGQVAVADPFTLELSASGDTIFASSSSEIVAIEDDEITLFLESRDLGQRLEFIAGNDDVLWMTDPDYPIVSAFDPSAQMIVEQHLVMGPVGGGLEAPFTANAEAVFGVTYGGEIFRVDRAGPAS